MLRSLLPVFLGFGFASFSKATVMAVPRMLSTLQSIGSERRSQRLELSTSCSKHGINLYTRLLRHRIEGLPCGMLTQTFLFSLGLLLPRGFLYTSFAKGQGFHLSPRLEIAHKYIAGLVVNCFHHSAKSNL